MTETSTRGVRRGPLNALFIANLVALIGKQLSLIALPWFVLTTTGSAERTALVGFVIFLPGLVVGIFGGVLIDRLGFRRVAIAANLVSGFGILMIPLFYHTVGLPFWLLLVFVFIGALLEIPAITAGRSMVPELAVLAGRPLERVNALFESTQNLALLVGTPVAGLLVAWLGASNVLWLDAAASVTGAIVLGLAVPGSIFAAPVAATQRYLADVLTGLRFIRRDELLWPMVIVLALSNAISSSVVGLILPYYVKNTVGSAASLGLVIAALGAGAFLGATLYGLFAGRISRSLIWCGAYLIGPVGFWVFTASPPVGLLIAAFLLAGFVMGPINPLMVTIRHERSPTAIRGRVFSTYSAVAGAAAPLGILLAGLSVGQLGFRPSVVILAVCAQLLGIATLFMPAFRRMDVLPPQPAGSTDGEPAIL
jgi:MFS family permease